MNDKNIAFDQTFEWKGKPLFPFSQGRLRSAFSIGVRMGLGDAPTISDIHAILFICLSTPEALASSHRKPDAFWQLIDAWVDTNITPADYEAEANLVKEILQAAFATKAEAIPTTGEGGDNLGN